LTLPLFRRSFLALLYGLSIPAWAGADSPPPQSMHVTAALVNIAPWTITSPRQAPSGIMTEAIAELAKLSGAAIEVSIVPYARELLMLEHEPSALTLAYRTPRVDGIARLLVKLDMEDVIVVTPKSAQFHSLEDLRGKVVAQVRNADYLALTISDPLIRKYDTNGYEQSVKMLLEHRVDAIIGLRTSLSYAIAQNPDAVARFAPALKVASGEFCLYISHNFADQDLIRRLEAAAQHIARSKLIERLRSKYKFTGPPTVSP
jgi:ABC-type amino acid transport substrate-binding protein